MSQEMGSTEASPSQASMRVQWDTVEKTRRDMDPTLPGVAEEGRPQTGLGTLGPGSGRLSPSAARACGWEVPGHRDRTDVHSGPGGFSTQSGLWAASGGLKQWASILSQPWRCESEITASQGRAPSRGSGEGPFCLSQLLVGPMSLGGGHTFQPLLCLPVLSPLLGPISLPLSLVRALVITAGPLDNPGGCPQLTTLSRISKSQFPCDVTQAPGTGTCYLRALRAG